MNTSVIDFADVQPDGYYSLGAAIFTIQNTPYLSVAMPNVSPHICLPRGSTTLPPSDSLLKNPVSCASSSPDSDTLPLGLTPLPPGAGSLAISTMSSSLSSWACMTWSLTSSGASGSDSSK